MKVLMWLGGSFDRRTPSEHLLVAIIETLYDEGHIVHILQKDTGGELPSIPIRIKDLGVTTECIPSKQSKKSNFVARYVTDLKYIHDCKKILKKKHDFDVVFLQSNNEAGFITKFIKNKMHIPVLFNVQDIFPYNAAYSGRLKKDGLIFKVLKKIQSAGYFYSDKIVTISEDMKAQLLEDGVPSEKIEVIYNWSYQDEMYTSDQLDLSIPNKMFDHSKFNVLYAGNIGVMQNVDVLIEAAKLLKDDKTIQFHIVGDGVYKEKLINRTKEYNLENVKFWDMLDSSLAPSLYYSADVNIIPLSKDIYKTALPSKTATCLACNKPIIFCIGKNSIFGKRIQKHLQCPVLDCDDSASLANEIKNMKNRNHEYSFKSLFKTDFVKSINAKKYVNLIQEMRKK